MPFRFKVPSVAPDQVKVRVGANEFVARIKNVADGAIQLVLPVPVLTESNVVVAFSPDCTLEGNVLYCNRQGDFFCVGIYFSRNRNRRVRDTARHAVPAEKVTITLLREGGDSLNGWMVDMSASGIGLKLTSPISTGAWVKIALKSAIMFGEIRHCSQDPSGGFRAGVEIETSLSRTGVVETEDRVDETIYHLSDPSAER